MSCLKKPRKFYDSDWFRIYNLTRTSSSIINIEKKYNLFFSATEQISEWNQIKAHTLTYKISIKLFHFIGILFGGKVQSYNLICSIY